jgi:hypothetical protein
VSDEGPGIPMADRERVLRGSPGWIGLGDATVQVAPESDLP